MRYCGVGERHHRLDSKCGFAGTLCEVGGVTGGFAEGIELPLLYAGCGASSQCVLSQNIPLPPTAAERSLPEGDSE